MVMRTRGAVLAQGLGYVPPQGRAVLDDAVGVVQELDGFHADCGGAPTISSASRRGLDSWGLIELIPASPLVASR